MSRSTFALCIVIGASVTLVAQTPQPPTGPKPMWTVSTGFASPESAYFHPQSGSVFVSNINGRVLDKDGNGPLAR